MMYSTVTPQTDISPVAFFLLPIIIAATVWTVRRFRKPAKCFVRVTEDCDGRRRQEQIDVSVVEFLRDLAMAHGFGLTGDRPIQYNGTDIVARFAFEDDGTGNPKIDADTKLPIVLMWTIYHDMNRLNPDGTKKVRGQHARIWRVRSKDHDEGVENG